MKALMFSIMVTGCVTPESSMLGQPVSVEDGGSIDMKCGTGDYTDGSRIKITYSTTDDGMKSFYGFYDSLLKQPCQIQTVNGAKRCIPSMYSVLEHYYIDSSCLVEVVPVGVGCMAPPLYFWYGTAPDACSSNGVGHVYQAVKTTRPYIMYRKSTPTSACTRMADIIGTDFYSIAATYLVADTTFVEIHQP